MWIVRIDRNLVIAGYIVRPLVPAFLEVRNFSETLQLGLLKCLLHENLPIDFFDFPKVLVFLSIMVQKLFFYFYWNWVNFAPKHGHFCDKLITVVTS